MDIWPRLSDVSVLSEELKHLKAINTGAGRVIRGNIFSVASSKPPTAVNTRFNEVSRGMLTSVCARTGFILYFSVHVHGTCQRPAIMDVYYFAP